MWIYWHLKNRVFQLFRDWKGKLLGQNILWIFKKKKLWEKANTYQVLTINLQIYQQENFVCKVSQRTVKKLYPSTFCRSLRLGDACPKILTNQIEYNSGSLGCENFGPSYSLTSETKCTWESTKSGNCSVS